MALKITERAMLINLSISYWTGKAGDERMTDDLVKSRKVERSAVETKKMLIQPEALNLVKAARSRARTYHFQRTSPWIDGGTRVLPSAFYDEYSKKMREYHSEYETEVAQLVKNYDKLRGEARKRLGSLYRDEDYPSPPILRTKFSWGLNVFPIPDKGDWRVDLGAKGNADMAKQIEAQVKAACDIVTKDCWQRLYEVVAHLAAKLKDGDAVFRDSIISNIKDLVALLPKMNVAEDPKLDAMAKDVEKSLCKLDPEVLREDNKQRKAAQNAADDILAKMAGYIGAQ